MSMTEIQTTTTSNANVFNLSCSQSAEEAALGRKFVWWARSQIGVRWEHQGRKPGEGLDCVGLPVCDVRAHSLPINDMVEYGEVPTPAQLIACVQSNCKPVLHYGFGVLAVLWLRRKELPCHVGILNGEGGIIHAQRWRAGGCVVEESLTELWGKRVHSLWQYYQ